jgi:tRNA (guanine-N7-)-methyltransferase
MGRLAGADTNISAREAPTSWETSERAFEVNPYVRWQFDHPGHLLPRPSRAELDARRQRLAGEGLRVELGSGSGNFLLELARQHPHEHVLGFELRYKRLVKSARKLENAGLSRAWVLRDQAERFTDYFEPGTIDALYLHFPDPWPRPSQWKKRLVNGGFLRDVERMLRLGGLFQLKTDHSGYFLHVLRTCEDLPSLSIRFYSNDLQRKAPPVASPPSEFELLFRKRGKPVFCLILEKSA